ncbi:GAF domain-containing protein [Planobispora siamensis]|uniref:GAF domain-containing protein n=1 Tax=Planobispora siamensis TaxID=936338 RepID=A0A8J3SYA2_9ACTN|nr:GAF domain-containing protein [Planobispora siamensis]GIH97723.1 hypothetical protein Psi01_83530 [Planobispora siamensis]
MAAIPWPGDEIERLAELHALGALEVVPHADFSAIAELAAHLCQTPIALVNLIDAERQHFKGHFGTAEVSMDRQVAFCPYTICGRALLEIRDALDDERFRDDAVVAGEPYVRFYAGVPVLSAAGHGLGTVCVMDHRPRRLSPVQRRTLATLATAAAAQLQARHHGEVLQRLRTVTAREVGLLQRLAGDLRAPLAALHACLKVSDDGGGLDAAAEHCMAQALVRHRAPLTELVEELLLLAGMNSHLAAVLREGQPAATRPR